MKSASRVAHGSDGWRLEIEGPEGTTVLLGGMSSELMAVHFYALWLSAMAAASTGKDDPATALLRQYVTGGKH